MTATVMDDPISATLKKSFDGRPAFAANRGYDGRGLIRGGSSSPSVTNTVSRLDASLQIASKKTQSTVGQIQFDSPVQFIGNMGELLKEELSNITTTTRPKIIVLNPTASKEVANGGSNKVATSQNKAGDAIPKPKVVFFSPSGVQVGYKQVRPAGSGMFNVGNTCYLNSTLQALFHTPALYNYLSTNNAHLSACKGGQGTNGFVHNCMVCALTLTFRDSLRSAIIKPNRIYEKLKAICKHMVHGRQEDAHEFLRYLIEALQRSYILSEHPRAKNIDNASKETTPFNQIFGGYMRQDVTCLRCKYVSTTFQHFMDILLDIRQVSTIEDALQQHFRQERIGENSDNMYKCEKCQAKVPAKKRSLIERPPAVLCIQLKRFSLLGGKISKPVALNRLIDMSPYINNGGEDIKYKMVSMINHVGPSPNCGHYTAIGEANGNCFYQFDDASVRTISVVQALNTASYVVFYEMTKSSWERQLCHRESSSTSTVTTAATIHSESALSNAAATSSVGTSLPAPSNGQQQKPQAFNVTKPLASPQTTSSELKPKLSISGSANPLLPVVNKLGVVAANFKKSVVATVTSSTSSSNSGTKYGMKTPTPKIGSAPLVPYDDDDDDEEEENKSSAKSPVGIKSGAPQQQQQNKQQVATSKAISLSPFVPRAVMLKTAELELPRPSSSSSASSETQKSSSGTWTVTEVDHHNPSIASDGSCGSTSGNWVVTPIKNPTLSGPRPATPTLTTTVASVSRSLIPAKAAISLPTTASTSSNPTVKVVAKPSEDKISVIQSDKKQFDRELSSKTDMSKSSDETSKPKIVSREPFIPPTNGLSQKRGSIDDSDADDYDDELDRGRKKKRKHRDHDTSSDRQSGVIFQKVQNEKNYYRNSSSSSHNHGSGHRSNHHHHHDDHHRQERRNSWHPRDRSSNGGHRDQFQRRNSFGGGGGHRGYKDGQHYQHYSKGDRDNHGRKHY